MPSFLPLELEDKRPKEVIIYCKNQKTPLYKMETTPKPPKPPRPKKTKEPSIGEEPIERNQEVF